MVEPDVSVSPSSSPLAASTASTVPVKTRGVAGLGLFITGCWCRRARPGPPDDGQEFTRHPIPATPRALASKIGAVGVVAGGTKSAFQRGSELPRKTSILFGGDSRRCAKGESTPRTYRANCTSSPCDLRPRIAEDRPFRATRDSVDCSFRSLRTTSTQSSSRYSRAVASTRSSRSATSAISYASCHGEASFTTTTS